MCRSYIDDLEMMVVAIATARGSLRLAGSWEAVQ